MRSFTEEEMRMRSFTEEEMRSFTEEEWCEYWRSEMRSEAIYSRRHGMFDRAVAYDALSEVFPARCSDWEMYIRENAPSAYAAYLAEQLG